MPRTVTSITVFLASPTDVDHEREFVARTIQEWNDLNGRHRGVQFELLRYESSVSAGFGKDGQDVINTQIGEDYDLLIAIFWKRLGSATPRARSGTVEEYERAFERYKNGENVDISFIFKYVTVDFRKEDISQLNALTTF